MSYTDLENEPSDEDDSNINSLAYEQITIELNAEIDDLANLLDACPEHRLAEHLKLSYIKLSNKDKAFFIRLLSSPELVKYQRILLNAIIDD